MRLPYPQGRAARAVLAAGAAIALASTVVALGPTAIAGQPTLAADDASVFGADARPLDRVPADDSTRGLVYGGLRAARTGPCVGGYEIVGVTDRVMCTHGPDAFPAGLGRGKEIAPLAAPAPGVAAPAALAVCEGDGTSGKRVEVLYIHGSTSRYAQFLETFRTLAEGVDTIYNESARETGGERHVRFVTESVNGACRPVVRDVQITDAALNANDWAPLLNAVRAQGYTRTDRLYLQFTESTVYCGIGGFRGDTRKTDANRSNTGPEYGRADRNCWNPGVAAHELGHNLGAVNNNAPNGSGLAHCVDEWDVMCYKDSSSTVIVTRCADRAHDQRLDCNHDDYYHTNPAAGSYLANNFNVADNLFLIKGPGTGPPTTPPNPPGTNHARTATASTSFVSSWESLAAINDGFTPTSSADRSPRGLRQLAAAGRPVGAVHLAGRRVGEPRPGVLVRRQPGHRPAGLLFGAVLDRLGLGQRAGCERLRRRRQHVQHGHLHDREHHADPAEHDLPRRLLHRAAGGDRPGSVTAPRRVCAEAPQLPGRWCLRRRRKPRLPGSCGPCAEPPVSPLATSTIPECSSAGPPTPARSSV